MLTEFGAISFSPESRTGLLEADGSGWGAPFAAMLASAADTSSRVMG
jgi:hypothetical protein